MNHFNIKYSVLSSDICYNFCDCIAFFQFQPPVPNDPWEDIRNATEIHSDCPQRNPFTGEHVKPAVGNEDCLYLNVYTPKVTILFDVLNLYI